MTNWNDLYIYINLNNDTKVFHPKKKKIKNLKWVAKDPEGIKKT